ncbi:acyl-CoA dehydrogenase family protein [Mycobacterium sp.]|uniref:acyl-CoA dehydrogenase family protein n=1 Tax=Mycobacterium sp. TaxID=1785 RepID=UPI002D9A272E|nr:acyl-CoA dehydrogenase family protein [Mycobacterium sp.]
MNLELSDEQLALRDTVRRFLSERASIPGHVRPMLDDPTGTTDAVWRGLADLGATGLLVPEDHGGEGMSMTEAGLVCEELGAALHPGPWLSSAVAAPRALLRFGTDNQDTAVAELLAGLAAGSRIAAVALPTAGDTISTVVHRDGHAVLSGALGQVPDAAAADTLLVLAGDDSRPELLAVPTSGDGVEIVEDAGIDRSRKTFQVVFKDAPTHVVATGSAETAEALIDDMLIAWAADALGAARQVLGMTIEYAKVRRQFGSPIGSFQAVAHLCVDMYETVELARSGVLYALWAADDADRAERHRAALRLKAFSGRLATVGDQAIQVFGGIGFTWEHDAQLYLKRLLSFSRFLGSPGQYLQQLGATVAANGNEHRELTSIAP